MAPARKYAEVAVRAAWADLLLRLGLQERSQEAYDDALLRAYALTLDFEPAGVTAPPTGSALTGNATVTITHTVGTTPPFDARALQRQFDAQARRIAEG